MNRLKREKIVNQWDWPAVISMLVFCASQLCTWSSIRWICSLISWMSESIIFPPWNVGAAKTSSFTGPLENKQNCHVTCQKQQCISKDAATDVEYKKNISGILTCGPCACQWRRKLCDSRGWQSWTNWCRWLRTHHCVHRNELRSGQRADQRTVKLGQRVLQST